jgi:hypothetical protein
MEGIPPVGPSSGYFGNPYPQPPYAGAALGETAVEGAAIEGALGEGAAASLTLSEEALALLGAEAATLPEDACAGPAGIGAAAIVMGATAVGYIVFKAMGK